MHTTAGEAAGGAASAIHAPSNAPAPWGNEARFDVAALFAILVLSGVCRRGADRGERTWLDDAAALLEASLHLPESGIRAVLASLSPAMVDGAPGEGRGGDEARETRRGSALPFAGARESRVGDCEENVRRLPSVVTWFPYRDVRRAAATATEKAQEAREEAQEARKEAQEARETAAHVASDVEGCAHRREASGSAVCASPFSGASCVDTPGEHTNPAKGEGGGEWRPASARARLVELSLDARNQLVLLVIYVWASQHKGLDSRIAVALSQLCAWLHIAPQAEHLLLSAAHSSAVPSDLDLTAALAATGGKGRLGAAAVGAGAALASHGVQPALDLSTSSLLGAAGVLRAGNGGCNREQRTLSLLSFLAPPSSSSLPFVPFPLFPPPPL